MAEADEAPDEEGGDFSASERKRLRRLLQDDAYARRFKTTLKVWITTIGAVGTGVVAFSAIWNNFITRLFK
jgi:hypothetical protein